jgi:hypothetical protein
MCFGHLVLSPPSGQLCPVWPHVRATDFLMLPDSLGGIANGLREAPSACTLLSLCRSSARGLTAEGAAIGLSWSCPSRGGTQRAARRQSRRLRRHRRPGSDDYAGGACGGTPIRSGHAARAEAPEHRRRKGGGAPRANSFRMRNHWLAGLPPSADGRTLVLETTKNPGSWRWQALAGVL